MLELSMAMDKRGKAVNPWRGRQLNQCQNNRLLGSMPAPSNGDNGINQCHHYQWQWQSRRSRCHVKIARYPKNGGVNGKSMPKPPINQCTTRPIQRQWQSINGNGSNCSCQGVPQANVAKRWADATTKERGVSRQINAKSMHHPPHCRRRRCLPCQHHGGWLPWLDGHGMDGHGGRWWPC